VALQGKSDVVMTRAEARRRAAQQSGEVSVSVPAVSNGVPDDVPAAPEPVMAAGGITSTASPASLDLSGTAEHPASGERVRAEVAPLTRRRARERGREASGQASSVTNHVADTPAGSERAPGITGPVPTSPTEAIVDEFEAAARLFSFTGPTPVQAEPVAAQEASDADAAVSPHDSEASAPHKAGRRRRGSIKRMAAASASVGAIVAVGLLTVGMTMPPEAVASSDSALASVALPQKAGDVSTIDHDEIQAYVAPDAPAPVGEELDRSANYTTATLTEMAGTTGISNATSSYFTNNPACPVQWPFAVGVPITYGFGWRPGEFHTGADFTPGSGAHVQAIADGVVRVAQQGYQGYGVTVIIDHEIGGQHWASLYGHMQYGSLQVHAGEKVKVGQYIGRTGNTGFSFGAHTHVEIRQNGVTPIDPIPWLRSHNQC